MRHKLIQEIGREFSEFVFDLELDARRQKRRAFEQAADHRIDPVAHQAAKAFGDTGKFLRKFARLLAQERKFAIIEFEKFPVHASYNRSIFILPESSSTSATNSTGTLTGCARRSALTRKRSFKFFRARRQVALGLDRPRASRGSKSINAISISRRHLVQRIFVDGAPTEIGKAIVENRTAHRGRRRQILRGVEIGRIEKAEKIGHHFAPEPRFGNRASRRNASRRNDPFASLVAQVQLGLGVALLVRHAKRMHQRRRQTIVFGHSP